MSKSAKYEDSWPWVAVVPNDMESNSFYENEAVKYLSSDLKALLEKGDSEFWATVKASRSLHVALDSYLRYAVRPHDVRNTEHASHQHNSTSAATLNAQQQQQQQHFHRSERDLSRRVFMVYYRMTEPSLQVTAGEDRGNVLYSQWLVDIPKIFDICAVYGESNPDLVSKFVRNAFRIQPRYLGDLEQTFESVASNTEQVIGSILASGEDFGDLMDHLLYLLDTMSTLSSFIISHGDYSLLFAKESQKEKGKEAAKGLETRKDKGKAEEVKSSSSSSSSISASASPSNVLLAPNALMHFLLHVHVIDLSRVIMELSMEGTEIAQALQKVNSKLEFIHMEAIKYCLKTAGSGTACTSSILNLFDLVRKLEGQQLQGKSKLHLLEEKYHLSEELIRVIESGQLELTKSQCRYMDGILGPALQVQDLFVKLVYPEKEEEEANKSNGGKVGGIGTLSVVQQKQVETIKAILPDYGRGFIQACLEHYSFNVDLTVSHMMEGSLPFELATLDSTLETLQCESGAERGDESQGSESQKHSVHGELDLSVSTSSSGFKQNERSGGLNEKEEVKFTYYQKRDKVEVSELNLLEGDLVVKSKILNMYEDDYDDSIDFADNSLGHEIDDLEGLQGEHGQHVGGGMPKAQEKKAAAGSNKTFWVQDGKVYNYAKAGATEVKAGSAPNALHVARQKEEEEDRAKRKQAREDRLVKDDKKKPQGRPNNYKRKEKKKAQVGNHNRKARALRKQGL